MAGIHAWNALTSPALAGLAGERCVAVLPMGATEQHGPHLPLGTDTMIAEGLVARALGRVEAGGDVVELPSLAIGESSEHTSFAGTLSHEAETLLAMLAEIGAGLAGAGILKLVIVNAHGGQPQIVDLAAQRMRTRHAMLVVRASYMTWPLPCHLDGLDPGGHHVGLFETAMMLVLKPRLVAMAKAGAFESAAAGLAARHRRFGGAGRLGFAWQAEDLNPSGAVGRADEATAELGRELLDHHSGILAELIDDALDFDTRMFSGAIQGE